MYRFYNFIITNILYACTLTIPIIPFQHINKKHTCTTNGIYRIESAPHTSRSHSTSIKHSNPHQTREKAVHTQPEHDIGPYNNRTQQNEDP